MKWRSMKICWKSEETQLTAVHTTGNSDGIHEELIAQSTLEVRWRAHRPEIHSSSSELADISEFHYFIAGISHALSFYSIDHADHDVVLRLHFNGRTLNSYYLLGLERAIRGIAIQTSSVWLRIYPSSEGGGAHN